MNLDRLLGRVSEVNLNLNGQRVVGKISIGDHKPGIRCDANVGGIPTTGFGETPVEAIQNLKEFVQSRTPDNTSNDL